MVNPMVELRSQQVRLTGQQQNATISPSVTTTATGKPATTYSLHQATPRTQAYSVAGVALLQTQKQVTISQVAEQALEAVGKNLTRMKRELTHLVTSSGGSSSFAGVHERISQYKSQISQELEQAKVDNERVLDARLKVQYNGGPERTFTIPGLDLKRHRQQSEVLRIEFPGQGTAMLTLENTKDDNVVVSQIDRTLIPFGVRATFGADGKILFRMSDKDFNTMQQQVLVMGQGHRFPAGQPNVLQVQPEPDGVEDIPVALNNKEALRQSITKINGHLHHVQRSLDGITHFRHQVSHINASQVANPERVTHLAAQPFSSAKVTDQPFGTVYQALSAQANVRRHSVVALLSS